MKILSSFRNIFDRIFVIAGVLMGSQIPSFIQQYTNRLAGHVDELHYMITQLRQVALQNNKSLEEYVHKFVSSSDPEFSQQGLFMQQFISRWEELQQTLYHLSYSSLWAKPFIFIRSFQMDIFRSTVDSFEPTIPLGIEGLSYAFIGGIIGWMLYQIIVKSITLGFSRALASFK